MDFPGNLSSFHSEILQQTKLGQLCGKELLFRNRYKVVRMIGRGGFGITFLARDASLPGQPFCVIKQLRPKVSQPTVWEKARVRFEREAKTLAQLGSHSQIPLLLDYFVLEGEFYLVQEYVRGVTLARLVRRFGCLPEADVKRLLREMLPLLQYIHSNGVIHRDIKPQNVLCSHDDGRLVLIDFGAVKELIAKVGENSAKMPTTHFVGTMGFAPPEQISLRPVFGSDIYALGITCLYLLTGKPPLDFESDRQTGELLWQDTVELSEFFAEILGKMLKVPLEKRYLSARAILQELDLELPQDNLAQCLVLQQQSKTESSDSQEDSHLAITHSPVAKTATAIRDWKRRVQKKRQKRQITKIQSLISSPSDSC
ncbi:MAG: serine/threonine-protein kinase [Coleofasciculaceae cyanobacterium]